MRGIATFLTPDSHIPAEIRHEPNLASCPRRELRLAKHDTPSNPIARSSAGTGRSNLCPLPSKANLRTLVAACNYDVGSLALRLRLSARHLRRLFATQLGSSPKRWMHEERLQASLYLLLSAMSVKEVALTLAFGNPSQFSRDFRARFGCSPSVYRQIKRRFNRRL
jgi:AraC-like DNA-binding protein